MAGCGTASYPAQEIDGEPQWEAGGEAEVTSCGQTPPQIDEGRMTSQERPEQKECVGLTEQTEVTYCYNRCCTEPGALRALTDFCLLPSGVWFVCF